MKNLPLSLNHKEILNIINLMNDEVIIYDNKYNIIYVNQACIRHYNCSAEYMIGKSFFDFIDNNSWDCSILPVVYKEKKTFSIKQKTVSGIEILTIATPIFDNFNNIKYVVMNVRDALENIPLYNPDYISNSIYSDVNISGLSSKNPNMKKILSFIDRIKDTDVSCILNGESGTGKTFMANYIHSISARKDEPFISLNCGSIPANLIESELFGYEKGAFTGANTRGKKGIFELANKGTILLDEISELPYEAQSKLLHVLQEKKFIPVGGTSPTEVDVKVITATNKNLKNLINENKFREDLYYRINLVEITLPPLRERSEDIPDLINYFLNKVNQKYGTNKFFHSSVLNEFLANRWRGNIRELQHTIERLIITNEHDEIFLEDSFTLSESFSDKASCSPITPINFVDEVEKLEEKLIKEAYEKFRTSRKIADYLNISQTKANNLIRKYIKNTL